MDPTLLAAYIGILGVVLGVAATYALQWWTNKQSTTDENRRIATALALELMGQTQACAHCAVALARASKGDAGPATRDWMARYLPDQPRVYEALLPRLTVLDARSISSVVGFYSAVASARTVSRMLPRHIDVVTLDDEAELPPMNSPVNAIDEDGSRLVWDDTEDSQHARRSWKVAASRGYSALERLRPLVAKILNPYDLCHLDAVTDMALQVSRGQYNYDLPDDLYRIPTMAELDAAKKARESQAVEPQPQSA